MAYTNYDFILNHVKKDRINICVVSYGGSSSNTFAEVLHQNGYTSNTRRWEKFLCHCPKYVQLNIPIIYVYNDPVKSFLSMKRRGKIWIKNQRKLNNNRDIEISDENLLKSMYTQFRNWTDVKRRDVLIIKTEELFQPHIANKLRKFLLNPNLKGFPIPYVKPQTDYDKEIEEYKDLFKKFDKEIQYIRNFDVNNRKKV